MRVHILLIPFMVLLASCSEEIQISPEIILLPDKLVVAPKTAALAVGSTLTLRSYYIRGKRADTAQVPISWVSLDSTAQVNENGLVTGRSVGQARIVARYLAFADTARLTVVENSSALAIIQLTTPAQEVRVDSAFTLFAKGMNAAGAQVPIEVPTYVISDTSLVKMESSGRFLVKKAGTVRITATASGKSAEAEVTLARGGTFIKSGGYSVTGTVSLFVKDGVTQIRFSPDFSVSNGPDVRFYASAESKGSAVIARGIEIASFPRDYTAVLPAPAGVNLYSHNHLVIHCRAFNVTFGTAALR